MLRAAVQMHDGGSNGRSWLRSVVEVLQFGLQEAGHDLEIDGRFGSQTRDALRAFQRAVGLLPNAVAGKATWNRLEPKVASSLGDWFDRVQENLEDFDGDLSWVHLQEGHRGRPYWPGGAPGVTLDPGYDLGHASPDLLEHYDDLLSASQRSAIAAVLGVRGEAAKAALAASSTLASIRIAHDDAEFILPLLASSYWNEISDRFPRIQGNGVPAAIQTVMLSLAYNRGAQNRHLEVLRPSLDESDWVGAADKIGAMQQSHALRGIRRRRREEADLIRAELEFLQA